ncbi:MAG: type II toxin-antitoxin system RelE/ParE family toxin [Patescibacteria group bacterium]|nr:type II toxin-antitoxin system RelE/ParE family toxin [Patescibacteria group bacterium]
MQLILTPKALKHLEKLPKSQQTKIKKRLKALETNPFAGKKLFGELEELRSLKAWPYRIFYYIQDREKIFITAILHRQGAYK